jgi:hypothetical protein
MKKCGKCGSEDIKQIGPFARRKPEGAPADRTVDADYFSCQKCGQMWKEASGKSPRMLRKYEVKDTQGGAFIKTEGSEVFVTYEFAGKFKNPAPTGKMPKYIVGEFLFDNHKKTYEATIEYDDQSEVTFEMGSLQGTYSGGSGLDLRDNKNADGLISYKQ